MQFGVQVRVVLLWTYGLRILKAEFISRKIVAIIFVVKFILFFHTIAFTCLLARIESGAITPFSQRVCNMMSSPFPKARFSVDRTQKSLTNHQA